MRTWLATGPVPDAAVVFVDAPAASATADEYWAEVAACCGGRGSDGSGSFEALYVAVADRSRVLVLDGVEGVEAIEQGVGELLDRCPRLRVVVTTRTKGSWARLVDGHRDRMMLSSTGLGFTEDETAVHLRVSGVPQTMRAVQWIHRRTDGLPALIDGVRASLQHPPAPDPPAPDPPAPVDAETDRLGELIDSAVDSVVLGALADPALVPARQAILVSSAASAPMEVLAVWTDHAPDLMSTLAAAGLLESDCSGGPDPAEDPNRAVGRYPEAVRVSLRRLAERECPNALRAAESALIRHRLDGGDPHAALALAVEGRHWQQALQIVDEHWTALYTGGFLDTLGPALVERIPPAIADAHPTIAAIRRLHRQFAAPRDVPVVAAEPDTAAGVTPAPAETVMRTMTLRIDGRFTEAAAVCDAVAAEPVPVFDDLDDHVRHAYAFYYLHIGITYLLVDRADEATTMFRRAHSAGAGSFVERDAAGKLALTYALRGACTDAQAWLDEERRHPPLPQESEKLVRTAGCVAAALVALDRLDTEQALDILTELGTPADNEEFWGFVLYTHGQHALLAGMPADGLRDIDAQIRRYPKLYGGLSAALLEAVRADLHLACGHVAQAERLVEGRTHPLTAPVRARIRLLAADPAGAEAVVDRHRTDPAGTFRESMELAVLGAVAAAAGGDRCQAQRHLGRAIALSRQRGMLRPFTLLPAPMLQELATLGMDLPLDAHQAAAQFVVFPVYQPIVRLTPRERAVLDAVLVGGTASSIAAAEFVSINTVKSQLRSLYRKLGVHSRKDAIAAARRLGLG
ncbi:helix-turn-helix transcriptional regulator [Rhodococcus sp. YH1]|uniref:helix-turn-helix transcriptional regulator n=1 Tax=Rhodococcus sp. YH1 TaxID=89066 RepID=UPI0030846656